MSALYYVNVTIHVHAAMLWLGGMFFLGVVGAPVLRVVEPPALRQRIFQQLGLRARALGWWAIGILIVTGTLNLWFRGCRPGRRRRSPFVAVPPSSRGRMHCLAW